MWKKKTLLLAVLAVTLVACDTHPVPGEGESVVLVHGLGRSPASMALLAQRLKWAGYQVENVGYESLTAPFPEQVATLAAAVEACCTESPRVHFVGHSLGGLVIRRYLAEDGHPRLGRVVLLTPPSRGSHFVEWLGDVPAAVDALGPVGSALGTDSTDLPATLPPPDYEMGIIAGTRSVHPIGPLAIPGPDDGILSVEQTRVEGASLLVIPRTHFLIMNSRHTASAVIRFLRTGSFEEAG